MAWAQRVVSGPVVQLDLSERIHQLLVVCIADLYSARSNLDPDDEPILFRGILGEIHKITAWLSSIRWPGEKFWAEEIRCRLRTIYAVGSSLAILCSELNKVNTAKNTPDRGLVPPLVFVDDALYGILSALSSYITDLGARPSLGEQLRDIVESLDKVHKLWEIDGSFPLKFKLPDGVQHPLDDLLIYRAALIAVVYSSAQDTSSLINNNLFDMIVPIA
jgi:hypothetical protein